MADHISISPCSCTSCVKFRSSPSNEWTEFEFYKYEFGFTFPRIEEADFKPLDYGPLIAVIDSRIKTNTYTLKAAPQKPIEVVRFLAYGDDERVPLVSARTLILVCEYLEDEDLDKLLSNNWALAADLLSRVLILFVQSWYAVNNGCMEAEHVARVLRRFLAILVTVPTVSEQVVSILMNKELWINDAPSPLQIIETMCEKSLTCVDTVSLLCNMTRIEGMSNLLDKETNVVNLIKEKFFVCCRLIQAGNESGGLLLLLLVNLTPIDGFVEFIIESNAGYFMNVTLVQLLSNHNLPSTMDRAIWPFLKNMSLLSAGRKALMDNIDMYLGPILYPIAGPEELTTEEMRNLPSELQYLPKTKSRVKERSIKDCILDVLFSLCRYKKDREILRNADVYQILKHYHLAEKNEDLLEKIENLVNILIRKEDSEIEVDDLMEGLSINRGTKDDVPVE